MWSRIFSDVTSGCADIEIFPALLGFHGVLLRTLVSACSGMTERHKNIPEQDQLEEEYCGKWVAELMLTSQSKSLLMAPVLT